MPQNIHFSEIKKIKDFFAKKPLTKIYFWSIFIECTIVENCPFFAVFLINLYKILT